MTNRKALSKKVRFEVFKRDCFSCSYCGRSPPSVILECDHIDPVSKGGDNDLDNLTTACFDCNRGKSNRLLESIPKTVEEKRQLLAEKEEQLKAYKRLKKNIRSRQNREIKKIEAIFQDYYPDYSFNESFRNSIRINFLPALELEEIESAMYIAGQKCRTSNSATKYFCGICWNRIRG